MLVTLLQLVNLFIHRLFIHRLFIHKILQKGTKIQRRNERLRIKNNAKNSDKSTKMKNTKIHQIR